MCQICGHAHRFTLGWAGQSKRHLRGHLNNCSKLQKVAAKRKKNLVFMLLVKNASSNLLKFKQETLKLNSKKYFDRNDSEILDLKVG